MSVLVIENDNGCEQRFMFDEIKRHKVGDDGVVHLSVEGVEATPDGSVRGTFIVKANEIQRII